METLVGGRTFAHYCVGVQFCSFGSRSRGKSFHGASGGGTLHSSPLGHASSAVYRANGRGRICHPSCRQLSLGGGIADCARGTCCDYRGPEVPGRGRPACLRVAGPLVHRGPIGLGARRSCRTGASGPRVPCSSTAPVSTTVGRCGATSRTRRWPRRYGHLSGVAREPHEIEV